MDLILKVLFKMGFFKTLKREADSGRSYLYDKYHIDGDNKSKAEIQKPITRTEVINFLISRFNGDTTYLEIGVRNPDDNFNSITCTVKYSVDPGYESVDNLVDFKVTSDDFFAQLSKNEILSSDIKFDVIFIDGLHLAEQVHRDIKNSLKYLTENGFLVLHDCNPPTEFHASETYEYRKSPSRGYWNGTTWKAFFDFRKRKDYYSCCIDTDWGIGIISKTTNLGRPTSVVNSFYEYNVFDRNRKESLNLISFEEFKQRLG